MAAPFSNGRSPSQLSRRESSHPKDPDADGDLSQSLKQLSLSRDTRSPGMSPLTPGSQQWPSLHRSPSSASMRSASRSPMNGISASNGRDSPSTASPNLLRKASLQSLRSTGGVRPSPQRRASSVHMSSPGPPLRSPQHGASPGMAEKSPEKTPLTAASVANTYFQDELSVNHRADTFTSTETVVVLHDACYGHRYSRPRTSKASLNTIVERPERIKASVLGVSLAYVRLGDRHCEGEFGPHPKLSPSSLPSIPFRIQKTDRKLALTSQTVTNVHGTKWMEELKIMCDSAEAKLAMNGKELQRPEISRGSDQESPRKLHEGDLYLCSESLDAFEGALGAVCEAVDTVFGPSPQKRAFVAVRPPGHHCSASYPSGFCWINNVHVGIMHAILAHGLTHAAIIDFDLHHGDGSQDIAWKHNSRGVGLPKNAAWWKKPSIGYFSLHDINSYPCEMGDEEKVKNASLCIDNAHGQNMWNVHLQPWNNEAEFWDLYEDRYMILLDKARSFLRLQSGRFRASNQIPKGAIFLSAGFDASEWEGSGMQRHNVNVPTEFYARLTRDVTRLAAEEGIDVEGRIISVLEGGYSDRALYSGVLSHLSGLVGDCPDPPMAQDHNGLGYEMGSRMNDIPESGGRNGTTPRPYEASWWCVKELERFEYAMAAPLPPAVENKKPRNITPGNYSSPTQASQAKAAVPLRVRKSTSGMSLNKAAAAAAVRPPSPPPPEVPWTIAAHELSKLLVPSDRETASCRPEDLSAEATRARRDRQANLTLSLPSGITLSGMDAAPAPSAPTRMSTRDRRPPKPFMPIDEEDDLNKNRRKTVAGATVASEKSTRGPGRPPKQPGRRLSAASTAVSETAELEPPLSAGTIGTRPSTSHSTRPSSAMSVRTNSGGALGVKKTRTTTAAKKDAPKGPRGQKKSASAATSPTCESAMPTMVSAMPMAPSSDQDENSREQSPNSVDNITGGMKKIKINVVTKEQREARERERVDKERFESEQATAAGFRPEAKLSSPEPIPEEDEALVQMSSPSKKQPFGNAANLSTPKLTPAQTPQHERVALLSTADPGQVPLPASSPISATPPHVRISTPDVFVPYQPEGPTPEAAHQQQQQPLKWLPPNTSQTPSPMKRQDLPVFTSTSAIPFAPRRAEDLQPPPFKVEDPATKEEQREFHESVWDVPQTPAK